MTIARDILEGQVEWSEGQEWHGTKGREPVSIVICGLPKEKYTDNELEKIVEFSKSVTKKYDKMFRTRKCANFYQIDKRGEDGTLNAWLRIKFSYIFGNSPFYSDTLDDALKRLGGIYENK